MKTQEADKISHLGGFIIWTIRLFKGKSSTWQHHKFAFEVGLFTLILLVIAAKLLLG